MSSLPHKLDVGAQDSLPRLPLRLKFKEGEMAVQKLLIVGGALQEAKHWLLGESLLARLASEQQLLP